MQKLLSQLDLSPLDWVSASSPPPDANRHRNVALVLGCLAEKLAGPGSVMLFAKQVLEYLLANMVGRRRDS